MKFTIRRASLRNPMCCPLDGAKLEVHPKITYLNFSDPKLVPWHSGESTDWWFKEGVNHRVVDGCIGNRQRHLA